MILEQMKMTGPMGMARSGGQILYDLAIKDVDSLIGNREMYGSHLYSYFIDKGEPTPNFFKAVRTFLPLSMVGKNPVSFVASLTRIATIQLILSGEFKSSADKTDSYEG